MKLLEGVLIRQELENKFRLTVRVTMPALYHIVNSLEQQDILSRI